MILGTLTQRLRSAPHGRILSHRGAAVVTRAFPDVADDVENVLASVRRGGIVPGCHVGILAHNCYEWLVYDLALVQLGAVCVPLPMDFFAETPPDELAARYGLVLLLIGPDDERTRPRWCARMRLDGDDPFELRAGAVEPAGSDLFSLVFSSGTSGQLKCLKISRRGTEALIESFGRDFAFQPTDLILAFLPLSSFQQRWMLYTAVHYGFSLGLTVPTRLFHGLRDMRPTVLGAAPLLYETVQAKYAELPRRTQLVLDVLRRALMRLPGRMRRPIARRVFRKLHDAFGGRLRLAIAGAAPIRRTTLDFFESIGMTLYSAYGLTEAGFLSWNLPGRVRLGSVGKPVYPGTLELTPDGEIIFARAALLSFGYLHVDEHEERKTFLGPGRIATGDIGRFDDDGYLYIEGRKKDIIVTQGGYKLQPEDLERAIERDANVSKALVFGGGDLSCVTAVVATREQADARARAAIESAIEGVNRGLPPPSRIGKVVFTTQAFTLESGLLNRNLKIDRKRALARFQDEIAT